MKPAGEPGADPEVDLDLDLDTRPDTGPDTGAEPPPGERATAGSASGGVAPRVWWIVAAAAVAMIAVVTLSGWGPWREAPPTGTEQQTPDPEDWFVGELPDPPEELGDDGELDGLWRECSDGDDSACADLWLSSPVDSAYEEFGGSCGGRDPILMSCADLAEDRLEQSHDGSFGDNLFKDEAVPS